jgi:hypothetical protein
LCGCRALVGTWRIVEEAVAITGSQAGVGVGAREARSYDAKPTLRFRASGDPIRQGRGNTRRSNACLCPDPDAAFERCRLASGRHGALRNNRFRAEGLSAAARHPRVPIGGAKAQTPARVRPARINRAPPPARSRHDIPVMSGLPCRTCHAGSSQSGLANRALPIGPSRSARKAEWRAARPRRPPARTTLIVASRQPI